MADAPMPVSFRPATAADAEAIHALLAAPARAGLVLPRPVSEIRHRAADFLVARLGTDVVGTVALRDYGAGLFEVRSLVVDEQVRGRGIGSALIERVVDLAARRQARLVFALTYHPQLFGRLGFEVVAKERFPQKVWSDCRHCSKREQCDEIALLRVIEGATR